MTKPEKCKRKEPDRPEPCLAGCRRSAPALPAIPGACTRLGFAAHLPPRVRRSPRGCLGQGRCRGAWAGRGHLIHAVPPAGLGRPFPRLSTLPTHRPAQRATDRGGVRRGPPAKQALPRAPNIRQVPQAPGPPPMTVMHTTQPIAAAWRRWGTEVAPSLHSPGLPRSPRESRGGDPTPQDSSLRLR